MKRKLLINHQYVVARSAATNRPVCQHIVGQVGNHELITRCGYDLTGASVTFMQEPLPAILCQRCKKESI